jgi:small subunit ribosomal protein S17
MPRKPKEDQEEQDDAPITEKVGEAVSTVTEKLGDTVSGAGGVVGEVVATVTEKVGGAISAAGDIVEGPVSAVGERVGDVVSSIRGGGEDGEEAGEDEAEGVGEEEALVQENEALPAVVSLQGQPTPAARLPEYLKGRRVEMGRVVSDKMQKTVVVLVQRSKTHPLYKKVIRRSVKFMAHDEIGAHTGDTVRIIESRPMSRHKRWQVVEIVQKAERV